MWDLITTFLIGISGWLDRLIAWVIDQLYSLIMLIADTNVFGPEAIKMFGRRIYVLLGVFMLFKLSFSLVNYLINPDDFKSNEKGFGKIITNTFIVLGLIVMTPIIFDQLYIVQGKLLSNNTVGQIILGVGSSHGSDEESNAKQGREISFSVFSAFLTPNPEMSGMDACAGVYSDPDNSGSCIDAIGAAGFDQAALDFQVALSERNAGKLFSSSIIFAKESDQYLFDYKFLISTLTGAVVAYILLGFAIDVAVRSVKLGFLQLIAPIPIVSYIDPKSGKDGLFKKWINETIKTFIDLFVRLAALFFAVFIISLITNNESVVISTGEAFSFRNHPFVKIFVILGALIFAKQVPQLIGDLFGVKLGGGMSLNPMKKISASPLASAALGGAMGFVGGTAANVIARGTEKAGIGQMLTSGVGGGFSAARRATVAGLRGDGKGGGISPIGAAGAGVAASAAARNKRDTIRTHNEQQENKADQLRFIDRNIKEPVKAWAGVQNPDAGIGQIDKRIKEIDRDMTNLSQEEDSFRREQAKVVSENITKGNYTRDDYRLVHEGLRNEDGTKITENYIDETGQSTTRTYYSHSDYTAAMEKYNNDIRDSNIRNNEDKPMRTIMSERDYVATTKLQSTIETIDNRSEVLRSEKGRLEKASKARKSVGTKREGKK